MRRFIFPILLLILACLTGIVSAQTSEPTQTPYIIYVVVTATPEPVTEQAEVPEIQRPEEDETLTIVNPYVNGNSNSESGTVTIINQTLSSDTSYAGSTEELISRIVATVMAQTSATAGVTDTAIQNNTVASGGALVHQSDGSTCTMNFELVSEPTYPAGSVIPRGEIFWKEWVIRNTGTCTWTQDWEWVFDKGWQIGNTRFSMKRNTAPGETLTVRLAMVPDQKQDGNYYSTYAFEAPDGTRFGTITSSYTVKDPSYFNPKPTVPPTKPKSGRPAGPEIGVPHDWGWWDWPWGPPPNPPKH